MLFLDNLTYSLNTVGRFSLVQDAFGSLVAFNFMKVMEHIPELSRV